MSKNNGLVKCEAHGSRNAAIVCCHQVNACDRIVGFVENSADPDDLQAWCDACESMFQQEGDMTDTFRQFNDFRVVCASCYEQIKARNEKIR
jgi:hypothetical protein